MKPHVYVIDRADNFEYSCESSKNLITTDIYIKHTLYINSLSASLLLNIFLSFEAGIAHAIANFKWKENTSSLKN